MGFKSLNEIIGRTDLLRQVSKGSESLDDLDLNPLFVQTDPGENKRYCEKKIINKVPDTLDEQIYKDVKEKFNNEEKIHQSYDIKNIHRAVGTRLSHYIYKEFNKKKLPEDFISVDLFGSAGQSFGAFGIEGLKLRLFGDANDYVGKGLSGAKLVIHPPKESNLKSDENTIIGNTVLYGATSGKLFASGKAGERFAVRNSGAISVIEGCDTNGCEYMTRGTVVILGKVGDNFAAGMTGGMAFIYDLNDQFEKRVNPETVVWQKPETQYWINYLKNLIEEHYKETNSNLSKKIIDNFDNEISNFFQVCPKEMINKLENPITDKINIQEVS